MSGRAKRLAILLLAVALLAVLLTGAVKGMRVVGRVESLRTHLDRLEARAQGDLFANLEREQLDEVRRDLSEAGEDLRALEAELGPVLFLAPHLSWVPGVGGDLAAAPRLLKIGIGVSSAAELVLEGLDPVLPLLEGSAGASPEAGMGQALSAALVAGQPRFTSARAQLQQVTQLRQQIDEQQLSPTVARLLERLDRYVPLLDTGLQVLLVAPRLLGAGEQHSYLLLAQNEHELRATGGFISSVALLRIEDGRIVELDFRDSYAVDDLSRPHPSAPEPLERYMLAQVWLLRDANWYADFPSSARVAKDLYELDQGVTVDGVIAADLTALRWLVGALGPIFVEEYGVTVDEGNVVDLIEEYWASPEGEGQTGDWWAHRKDFMGQVLEAMLKGVEGDFANLDARALIQALQRGLEEKHLLLYLEEPEVKRVLAENRWDGALQATDGDFLMVVDTNMGFNKVNPNVDSGVDYQVVIGADGSVESRVSVSHANRSRSAVPRCVQEARYAPTYEQMMEGCYWDYLRVYVPDTAELIAGPEVALPEGSLRARDTGLGGVTLLPDVGPLETGKNVFGTFFVVAPGEERETVFQYQVPSGVLELQDGASTYRLLVQKQPGTLAVPLRVAVTLPPGSQVLSSKPEPTSVAEGTVEFQTNLVVDREFEIMFR